MTSPIQWEENPLDILRQCDGYYECPESDDGKLHGPLVGYAGEYEPGKHWVGKVYANVAKAEEHPAALRKCVGLLMPKIRWAFEGGNVVFCGAPMGGIVFGSMIAEQSGCRFVFPEKKVTRAAVGKERERSVLIFGRHELAVDDEVVIVEDVTNNFSTTNELIRLILENGAYPVGIASFLNRSLVIDDQYEFNIEGATGILPVISLVRKRIQQFTQDSPGIKEELLRGNIVWKPKHEWKRLMDAVNRASA